MKIIVHVTKELDDLWIDEEQAEGASDSDIISLINEDLVCFVDGASFSIERIK